MFNCMLIDLKGMLTQGFKMGNAEIERPKSISTATAVTAQIIAQVASHIYGGTTINRIDEVLAPFVTERALISIAKPLKSGRSQMPVMRIPVPRKSATTHSSPSYEVNTLHTANGQTPFVTFGFAWEPAGNRV